MQSLYKRVGEARKQDEVISIDIIKSVEEILEGEWSVAYEDHARVCVAEMRLWSLAGFCTGLWGEEMVKIEWVGSV